jgi:hypothetical protein
MTAYLLITGIIGIGALIANHDQSSNAKPAALRTVARGPMDRRSRSEHIKRMYFEKQRRAKIARDERMALAEGWGRYV